MVLTLKIPYSLFDFNVYTILCFDRSLRSFLLSCSSHVEHESDALKFTFVFIYIVLWYTSSPLTGSCFQHLAWLGAI